MSRLVTQIALDHRPKLDTAPKPYALEISLAISLPKVRKFLNSSEFQATRSDLLMEKVTEIGVAQIIPITTKRSIEPVTETK
jgi:16S rRNA U1498 N3-methylase RsmE